MKIELTETEIIHIMDSLRVRINDLRGEVAQWGGAETADLANELEELEHDLFEASARPGDWTEDLEPTEIAEPEWSDPEDPDLFMDPVAFAVKHDKGTSRACERRNFNLKGPDPKLSKTQMHDVWDANDPRNW